MTIAHLIKQKSYEKVKYVLRRHPITFISQIILFVASAGLPVLVYLMITNIYPNLLEKETVIAAATVAGSIYYLSALLFFFGNFVDFYLDVWIVTNDRIVDIEQFGLFSRTISELDLYRIQDVTADIHGFFSTMFKYGTLTITTASTNLNIVFKNIPNPNNIRQHLLELANEDFKYHHNQT